MLMRWLHIYISMLGLGALLFFSLTGLTLNHPDWMFGGVRKTQQAKGQLNTNWLAAGADEKAVDKLAVVEELRRSHGLRGLVDDFRVEDAECSIVFKGPGSSADVVIDRRTGSYRVTTASEGLVAVMNDLHKGRHTGSAWSVVIDMSAVVLSLVAVSGIWLLLYVKRRRASGLWMGLAGVLLLGILYFVGVR